jgi:GT2 family glycosyltransferase
MRQSDNLEATNILTRQPLVSIVVPTRNRPALLMRVIEALTHQSYNHFEIIVVDQSDEENHLIEPLIAGSSRPLRIIRDRAKGAARARNIGLRDAKGELVLYLEDDLEIPGCDLVENHVQAYDDGRVGGTSGRVIETINRSSRGPVGRVYPVLCVPGGNGNGDLRQFIETVKGGNMSFRRDLLEQVHGFDERFGQPCMYEETDVSLKIRRLGYRLLFLPDASVVHLSAPSGGQRANFDPARFRYIAYRDRVLLFRNNYPAWLFPLFLVANAATALLPVARGNFASARMAVAGLGAGVRQFRHVNMSQSAS